MKNAIYASTGDFLGMANGYNYRLLPTLAPQIKCDGFEFMVYSAWYADFENVINEVAGYGISFPVIHFDKCIGILLAENTAESVEKAKRDFTKNVWAAKRLGSKKAVFHLWGGKNSDIFIDRSLAYLPDFYRECDAAGIDLLIENIPAKYGGPYFNWSKVREAYPDARFIYDTRFGEFHAEHDLIMLGGMWRRVRHMHVSSYERGTMKTWGLLRPILHPGEGAVDLPAIVARMPAYEHSVTLESPVLSANGSINIPKLNASLAFLYRIFGEKN